MAVDLKNRRVKRFRTHYDPSIGVKPMQAFDIEHMKQYRFELTPVGVYVKGNVVVPGNSKGRIEEHIVPFGNIVSIMFCTEEHQEKLEAEEKKAKQLAAEEPATPEGPPA